jgi:hypothetical protein
MDDNAKELMRRRRKPRQLASTLTRLTRLTGRALVTDFYEDPDIFFASVLNNNTGIPYAQGFILS